MRGRIFSIEEFATFDGPGIRTTVFLKGCPLKCTWCHNPEGQSFSAEYVRSPNGCLACGACIAHAARRADGSLLLTEASKNACPRELVRLCGEDVEVGELCERILSNSDIFHSTGGGVTFSGGDPLGQSEFLLACLSYLNGKTHRTVQTCGYASKDVFLRVLDHCEYMLFDLKIMDRAAHLAYCGVDNAIIHENYSALVRSGVDFVTRVPLIPGVTDTAENMEAIARFISGLGVQYIELLPYNSMAGSKYGSLLREYKPRFDPKRKLCWGSDIFKHYGIVSKKM
ncbi:MAG: glycyl-radical enzyme activating protein [Clostridia bacterium]|nr:glycyl-radical enzyme activating protein [Clostridia bacterium]